MYSEQYHSCTSTAQYTLVTAHLLGQIKYTHKVDNSDYAISSRLAQEVGHFRQFIVCTSKRIFPAKHCIKLIISPLPAQTHSKTYTPLGGSLVGPEDFRPLGGGEWDVLVVPYQYMGWQIREQTLPSTWGQGYSAVWYTLIHEPSICYY